MKLFNFRKTIKRNNFTTIFGRVGGRRTLSHYKNNRIYVLRTPEMKSLFLCLNWSRRPKYKMQMIRRSNQGWRNRIYGSVQALKLRLQFGRRKSVPQFRR